MLFLLLSLIVFTSFEESQTYSGHSYCDQFGTYFYEELGCESRTESQRICPDYYVCPNFKRDTEFCMFGGKIYHIGDKVDGTSNCKICECKLILLDGKISAGIKCHPVGGCQNFNNETCTNKYVVDRCCPIEPYCTPAGQRKCDCLVDEYCYREGERFVPKDSCHECVCRKGFNGLYVAPFCRRRRCDLEAKFGNEIRANCAPVFDKVGEREAMCCPTRFICPDELNEIENIKYGHLQWQDCYFGKESINRNAAFYIHRKIIDGRITVLCKCVTPPLLTCFE